jgi:chlorobactene glucosyltransferase
MALVLSIGWLALAIWLISRAWRQRGALDVLRPQGLSAPPPHVSIIVPARNEAANIGPCMASLLAQQYPTDRLRLIVIEDNSTDETAAIVGARAATEPCLTLLHAPELPRGWTGKAHACWLASRAAEETEWLCFIDADMRANPQLLASALETARSDKIALLSLAPRHELRSFAERLMIPCGLYLLAFSQNLDRVQAPDSAEVVAMGQFMLVRRDAYEAVGGHAAVRAEICDDVALARLLKQSGAPVLLQDGSRLLSGRMYTGWATLWPGIAKNLTEMLGGPLSTITTALAGFVIAWAAVLVPLLDLYAWLAGSRDAGWALIPALAGSAMAFGLHIAGAVHFRIPAWYGLLFPFGYTTGAIMAFDSLRQRLTHRIRWKGRVYP